MYCIEADLVENRQTNCPNVSMQTILTISLKNLSFCRGQCIYREAESDYFRYHWNNQSIIQFCFEQLFGFHRENLTLKEGAVL